ncbi:Transcriptional activator flo8 [Tulasnella sp. 403]|nr:Transcriptional activator flo8 [Tulasnella sp. 403]
MAQQPPPQQGPPPPSAAIPMHPSTSVSAGSSTSNDSSPAMPQVNGRTHNNWDGDRMLHIYMLDYCRKRGFDGVVSALSEQTNTPPEVKAPIDAPQGLLFEWWVVFWEIFTAKSNEPSSKDAMAYLRAQRIKQEQHMHLKPPHNQIPMPLAPGQNFIPAPPPPHGPSMGPPPHQNGPFSMTPQQQQQPGGPHMHPNGTLPPQHSSGGPPAVPPPSQHINGPQPYPPSNSIQQPSQHPTQSQQPNQSPRPNPSHSLPPSQGPPHPGSLGNRGPGPAGMQSQQRPHPSYPGNPMSGPPPNGVAGQQAIFGGSPLGQGHPGAGPNGAPGPSPRIPSMGPPSQLPNQHATHPGAANASTPGSSGMVNGIPQNHTPTLASQQFQPQGGPGRPGSRSATPGGQPSGVPGTMGMSPSRMGLGPPVPRPRSRLGAVGMPGSIMGASAQQPGQYLPMQSGMAGPQQPVNANLPANTGLDQAVRAGLANKDFMSNEERLRLQNAMTGLRRGPNVAPGGITTPRIPSGANPMMAGNAGPGTPGQSGMPPHNGQHGPAGPSGSNYNGAPFPQSIPNPQGPMMTTKRSGSPIPAMASSPQDSSPSDRKRQRRNSHGGPAMNPTPGFAQGMPGANGTQGQQQQPPQQTPNGLLNNGMRPPAGSAQQPQQVNPMMMANGAGYPANANQMNAMRAQQHPGQQPPPLNRFGQMMPGNKGHGILQNPHGPGLPIVVSNTGPGDASTAEMMQHANPAAGVRGQVKVQPSPSMSAKPPPSMPPPSQTPNPMPASIKKEIKEEPSAMMPDVSGSTKSSPSNKAATHPNVPSSATPIPAPSTPAPALGTTPSNPFPISLSTDPSPAQVIANNANLNNSTPPSSMSRPGSSNPNANAGVMPNITATNSALTSGSLGRLSGFPPPDFYPTSFNGILEEYDIERIGKDDTLTAGFDADFDKYFMSDFSMGGLDDDATAATGGSS